MTKESWDCASYRSSMQDIEVLAAPALALLTHAKGKSLLDVGCGDGRLTKKLMESGYEVTGIDASADMVAAARQLGVKALRSGVTEMAFENAFDIVFSHAVLHWVKSPGAALAAISRALKAGGMFVAQFGGQGDARVIRSQIVRAMKARGYDVEALDPWYNPGIQDYDALMREAGLEPVVPTAILPWDYPLPAGMHAYVDMFFSDSLLSPVTGREKSRIIDDAVSGMAPELRDASGNWHADFRRMTVCARKATR